MVFFEDYEPSNQSSTFVTEEEDFGSSTCDATTGQGAPSQSHTAARADHEEDGCRERSTLALACHMSGV